jgi:hypothetical protein
MNRIPSFSAALLLILSTLAHAASEDVQHIEKVWLKAANAQQIPEDKSQRVAQILEKSLDQKVSCSEVQANALLASFGEFTRANFIGATSDADVDALARGLALLIEKSLAAQPILPEDRIKLDRSFQTATARIADQIKKQMLDALDVEDRRAWEPKISQMSSDFKTAMKKHIAALSASPLYPAFKEILDDKELDAVLAKFPASSVANLSKPPSLMMDRSEAIEFNAKSYFDNSVTNALFWMTDIPAKKWISPNKLFGKTYHMAVGTGSPQWPLSLKLSPATTAPQKQQRQPRRPSRPNPTSPRPPTSPAPHTPSPKRRLLTALFHHPPQHRNPQRKIHNLPQNHWAA